MPEKTYARKRATPPSNVVVSIDAAKAANQKWAIRKMVRESKDLTPAAKVVFWALSDLISAASPVAWPGEAKLAEMCGLSTSTTSKGVAALEGVGVLQVDRRKGGFWVDRDGKRRGRSNFYSLRPLDHRFTDSGPPNFGDREPSGLPKIGEKSLTYTESYNKENSWNEKQAKCWALMLRAARERGEWPSYRTPKESIPARFIEQWESENP